MTLEVSKLREDTEKLEEKLLKHRIALSTLYFHASY